MNQSSPATKADIQLLMEEMGKLYMFIDKRFEEQDEKMTRKMEESITQSERNMTDNFMLIAENLRYNMMGTHKDKISSLEEASKNHERRIKRLEAKV